MLTGTASSTFNQSIVCDPMLQRVSQGIIPNATDLELICDAPCAASLQALQKTQLEHCTDADNITVGYTVYPATYTTDLLLAAYNLAY